MAHSFSFDGVDLSTFGLTLLAASMVEIPPVELSARKVPQSDRSLVSPATYGPREFRLPVTVVGSSVSDVESKLTSIARTLNTRGDRELALDYRPDRYWLAQLVGGASFEQRGSVRRGELVFAAMEEPHGYSVTLSEVEGDMPGDSPLVITPGGSVEARPTLYYTADGAATAVAIGNADTDERVAWEGSLADGARLKFDCATERVYYSPDDTDDWVLSMSQVSGVFPRLVAGVENNVHLYAPSGGTLLVAYRARYL